MQRSFANCVHTVFDKQAPFFAFPDTMTATCSWHFHHSAEFIKFCLYEVHYKYSYRPRVSPPLSAGIWLSGLGWNFLMHIWCLFWTYLRTMCSAASEAALFLSMNGNWAGSFLYILFPGETPKQPIWVTCSCSMLGVTVYFDYAWRHCSRIP